MENKLQELTSQLYSEGLSKGKQQAEAMIAEAEVKAKEIIAKANADAQKISEDAAKAAEEFAKNTATEVSLASSQSVATLKSALSSLVVAKSISGATKQACMDAAFVKELLLAVAKSWNGVDGAKADLMASLPASIKDQADKVFLSSTQAILDAGLTIEYSEDVKSGFKVAPKEGGYYISFSDEDFKALLSGFLRPKVEKILF